MDGIKKLTEFIKLLAAVKYLYSVLYLHSQWFDICKHLFGIVGWMKKKKKSDRVSLATSGQTTFIWQNGENHMAPKLNDVRCAQRTENSIGWSKLLMANDIDFT